ncbi:hypothetical protein L6164_034547 [Bauhinia variegata]|uniref:Uncharacterized protein n=1 Tax=Bauhinia variegata TaxID=167791 RepID=A0ACB9KV64_BAUVA|nr:hypothetical protein L6164_034547 [Bauhinia variegata]
MDRTREGRRSSMSATTTNGFPRRRYRTIGLRDSSEEGQVELQETVRLRAVTCKRDRDRDRDRDSSSNRGKRRRASHREEGEQSTEESVGNEDDYVVEDVSRMLSPNTASSISDQNHRRSFPTSRPLRPTPPPWKVADEMIGVPVPRKARSASAKRSHDSWASASGGTEEQIFRQRSNSPGRLSVEATSPSSSNVSVRKKKSAGPKTRLPNAFKSSSSPQEDIEIEIAEVLYGLMTSKNQETSQKLESNDTHGISHDSKTLLSSQITYPQTSILPRSTSPSSRPFNDEDRTKMQDYSTLVSNNSTAESVKIASEQPGNVETLPLEPAKILSLNDDNSAGRETVSSEATIEDNGDNLCSGAGYDVTADRRSVSVTRKLSSCSKLNVDKQDSAAKRVISAVTEVKSQRVEKFEIDLMAPPPMVLSPEREGLSRGDFTSESMTLDVELKREDNIKVEDKVERIVKKEKAPEEIEETKLNAFKEKQDLLKLDLEKATRDNDSLTSNKLEERDRNGEEPPALTNPKVEKTVLSCSVPLSTSGWPSNFPPLGYKPPMQTSGNIDKVIEPSTAPQHANFGFSSAQPKRCATHHYIACNILQHQKSAKMNHFVPSAAVSSSLCGTKPNNMNVVPSAESVIVGKQSHQNLPGVNQDVAQEKGWAATGLSGLTANKSSDAANSKDSTQSKKLAIQQGPHPASAGNLVHGPAFLFPLGQHQASVTQATSQAGGANSTISAASSNKPNSSAAGSLGTSAAMPAVAAAISFSYPNLAANDAPYMTIVQNNGYPFPFSTPIGATPAIRGANPAQATPLLNVPLYSSQMFHPLQHPQQHPHSQTLVQPSYLNTSTSNGSSSSSQKQQQQRGVQVNGNNILTSTNIQLRQSQKQHTSLPLPRKFESETSAENAQSVASRTSYSQKNAYGQNFTIPFQPVNFSFRPSTASDSVSGNGGNFGDKQQQHQQALKGGVEHMPSQAFAISFATFNGTSVPSNLNFSSVPQNPVIFHSLPDVAWQGYQAAGASHSAQQKTYSTSEGKIGGNSTRQDDEKKTIPGMSSTSGPTTLVFDNSSRNLNFMLSPMTGSWPSHSVASSAITTNVPSSQQPPHLVPLQKQQHPMAAQFKGSSINNLSATKFANNPPVVSQTLAHSNSSNQASQSKSSGRTLDSQVHHTSIVTSTTPSLKNFSLEQGKVLQGHTQISFGGNYKACLPLQGQQLFSNNQPSCITVSGSLPNGGNMKPNSQGSKVGSSINTSQIQQTENSSAGTGQKSSPVCGRNVPSILSSCPSHLSELK